MIVEAYRKRAHDFGRNLMRQAAWPAVIVVAVGILTPLAASSHHRLVALPEALARSVAAAGAAGVLAFSALLAFDALLFRLMASHDDEASGGAAVDEMLTRMGLKPAPSTIRPLDDRIAGTHRLLFRQRAALGLFAAGLLVAGFWAAG
jgi:hypothetical protein